MKTVMTWALALIAYPWRAIREAWSDIAFRAIFLTAVVVLFAGTLFYRVSEGWSILNSLYFCVTTLTTIGYGDLVPTTDAAKVFTILYVFAGLGIIGAFVSTLAARTTRRAQKRVERRAKK